MAKRDSAGPLRVQIQTQSGCNGRCVFCPNEDVMKSHLEQGRMEPALFHKIIDELAELRPRRISPYLMNEPLLDTRLPELVGYIAEKVPSASTLVTTNGVKLSEDLSRRLIEAGLKRIKVSLQSLDPEVNKQLMGAQCDSDRVVENVVACRHVTREMARAGSTAAKNFDLRVSMIVTSLNRAEIEEARRFWRRHDVRLVTSVLENRGGNAPKAAELNPNAMRQFRGQCLRPSREMCILWNGDVVLCCVDWWRTVRLGNVARQSIRDVWNGARAEAIRSALKDADESRLPKICINCEESAAPVHRLTGIKRFLRDFLR